MKILFITQWWQPEPNFKGVPFANDLIRRGHQVEVITGFPNYPGGEVYPGYKIRLYQREDMGDIIVHRVALYPSHDDSTIKRIINYLSFALTSFLLSLFVLKKKPDVIYVYNLVTLGPTALLVKLWSGAKIVYDIQDLWPESVVNSGMLGGNLVSKTILIWCKALYKLIDHLVVLSDGFKEHLICVGVPKKKISVIYNWYDEEKIEKKLSRAKEFSPDFFNIVFAGTMGKMQALDTILDAAMLLQEEKCKNIRFFLIGGGIEVEKLKKKAETLSLENLVFTGRIKKDKVNSYLQSADVLLVHLKDISLFSITIPSKIQAYLANGRPILVGVRGDATDLVLKANAGIPFTPEDVTSLKNSILQMASMSKERLSELGQNGRKFYLKELRFSIAINKFEKLFFYLGHRI